MTDETVVNEDVVQDEAVVTEDISDETPESEDLDVDEQSDTDDDSDEVEFPKKAVNAINRRDKKIKKLRARLRELETQSDETPKVSQSELNPDDFDTYGEYIDAQVKSLVTQTTEQTKYDMQKQQRQQELESVKAQRDQYIIEQAQEASQTLTDLPQVWQQHAQTLDSLPKEIEDIFYSIDNAPAAVYTLAKEGKLDSLRYANPYVAAQEILNAQNKGLQLLSKPQTRVSQAPKPIEKARGTGSIKKQLSTNDDVLKSLGFK